MGCFSSKHIDDTTLDVGPTEPKPATNAASPETNISTAREVQVLLPTGPDVSQFESSGQATGRAETIPPVAAPHPTRRSTHKDRPHTVVGGFNPPETPGQAPFPPLPSARARRGSAPTQPDEAPKSHRHSSGVKQSAPGGSLSASTDPDMKSLHPSNHSALQFQPRLETDELWDRLSSASGKRPKRPDILDHTGKLKDRTKPKFTGGFSDISQAKLGGRVVAVKALRLPNIESGGDNRIWKHLEREIYVWAPLNHQNVLGILGFAIEDGIPCLISLWCDGGTLLQYLQEFPDADRRRLVREIAEGLRYLHMQLPPIIHGDLKTTNVFVTSDNVVKIKDFGCSRRVEQFRPGFANTSLVLATIRNSAPEILQDGQHPTQSSDVFSFACVALETITDKCPFWKIPNAVGVITEVVFKKQAPSPEDHPGMEGIIWELVRRCWNYEPSDRPYMADVCKMLSRAGYGSSTSFYPPTRAGPSNTRVGPLSRPGRSTATV